MDNVRNDRRSRIGPLVGSATLLAGTLVGAGSGAALAGAAGTGCPGSFEVLSVATLTSQGYDVAFLTRVDANRDGTICGHAFSAQKQENYCTSQPGGCTVPTIYAARDNDVAHR
jgi:hypothetical protein